MRERRKPQIDPAQICDSLKKASLLISRLRAIREKLDYKISEIARSCNVSRQTVVDWEAGKYCPKLTTTVLLMNFLAQRQELYRLASRYSQEAIRRGRDLERREEPGWEAGNFYAAHPEALKRLELENPDYYTRLIPFLPQALRR